MDQSLQKIKETLDRYQNFTIVVGRDAHIDEMGAALSLYLTLSGRQKKVSIASSKEPIVELSSLVGIDKVKTVLSKDSGGDLVVSFPYKEGEIEKVSYTLENGYLNIIVKAGVEGLSFSEQDVRYQRGTGEKIDVLFVVGTPRLSDLGDLFDPEALKDTTVVNIDNKGDNQGFGDIVYVSSKYSSVSEQVANLLSQLGLPIDVDIAQNLLSGISYATNNFQKENTSLFAFEMAAQLMRKGARRERAKPSYSDFDLLQQVQPSKQAQDMRKLPFSKKDESFFEEDEDMMPAYQSPIQRQKPQAPRNAPSVLQQKAKAQEVVEKVDKTTPSDWLAPKIYKGSTEV